MVNLRFKGGGNTNIGRWAAWIKRKGMGGVQGTKGAQWVHLHKMSQKQQTERRKLRTRVPNCPKPGSCNDRNGQEIEPFEQNRDCACASWGGRTCQKIRCY